MTSPATMLKSSDDADRRLDRFEDRHELILGAGSLVLLAGVVALSASGLRPSAMPVPPSASAIAVTLLAMLSAVFVPVLGESTARTRILIAMATVPFLGLIGVLDRLSLSACAELSLKMTAFVGVCPTIWALLRGWPLLQKMWWVALLVTTAGLPVLSYLASDFGSGSGRLSHWMAAFWLASTFSH